MIQVIAYGIDISIFYLLIKLVLLNPILANVICKTAAGCFAFFAHVYITFESYTISLKTQAVKYFALLFLNIPLSSIILKLLLTYISSVTLAKILSDAICIMISFSLSKYFVFTLNKSKL